MVRDPLPRLVGRSASDMSMIETVVVDRCRRGRDCLHFLAQEPGLWGWHSHGGEASHIAAGLSGNRITLTLPQTIATNTLQL